MTWVKPQAGALTEKASVLCAEYILGWLYKRNNAELADVFDNMRQKDYRNLKEELIMILQNGGKPANWVA